MPPTLHPRSTATTSLFTGTLLVSFAVVALPHLFPCPVPSKQFADANGIRFDENGRPIRIVSKEESEKLRSERECPVPKPSGYVGRFLGFGNKATEPRVDVKVEKRDEGRG